MGRENNILVDFCFLKRNDENPAAVTTAAAGEKLHPNVVAVLFVTVLNCCC